jgi:glutamyl-tRNA synthetase/glutamyl-Q tRNA(Asp) synthetase
VAARPDLGRLPARPTTRFAPAPTGFLHLGHLANAVFVWGLAGATGGRVILRIEDHDRQRSRAEYDAAILADLARLGLAAEVGPVRQADDPAPYAAALEALRGAGLVYTCDCARSTFAGWAAANGQPWSGPGCPGACRARDLADGPGRSLRVALGDGEEAWTDLAGGPRSGPVAPAGDLLVRDRAGNWTYPFCVVVDDHRQGVDLVIRGEDLVEATAPQIRLGRLLGRATPPAFLHHPLVLRPDGAKLSKADRDPSIRARLAAGATPAELLGLAAAEVGLAEPGTVLRPDDLANLFPDAGQTGDDRIASLGATEVSQR